MTRRRVLGVVGSAPLAFAGDFWPGDVWNDRPASEWSEKDANRLREHSPWARVSTAERQGGGIPLRPPGGGGGGGRRGGGLMDAGGSEGSGRGGGAGGMGDGIPPMPEVTIRWESAKPMQEASAITEAPLAQQIGKLSEQFYVLTAVGLPAIGGAGRGPGGPPAQDRAKVLQQRLLQGTRLRRKDKPDIAPEEVGMVQTKKGPMLVFLFSRSASITADDKDVIFECSSGSARVKTKFALKDMLYKGDLAL